jgi:Zn-dependent M28 family amino/carboxypeptidase
MISSAGLVLVLLLQDSRVPTALEKAESRVEGAAMRKHVEFLASDDLKGRLCGSAGNDKAAEYIAALYKKFGFKPFGDADDAGQRGYFQTFTFKSARKEFKTKNVVAILRGSDEKLKDEVVVVGAHFDHVGTAKDPDPGRMPPGDDEGSDTIYNGADDNASGTSGLLMLAQAMADAGLQPKRSIVFIHFNGEEWGLKGSEAYVNNPPVPVKNHVAMINFDMLGRNSTKSVTLKGAGSCGLWEDLAKKSNAGVDLKYKIVKAATGSTDYLNFLKKQIPALGFFTELHADYHAPSDHAEKLDYERMEKIIKVALRMTVELADADKRPEWTAPPGWK